MVKCHRNLASHGPQAIARGDSAHEGMDQEPPAPAGQGVYRRTQSAAGRALQLLWSTGQLGGPVALLPNGRHLRVQVAKPARGQAQELYMGGIRSRHRKAWHRQTPHYRVALLATRVGVCVKSRARAKASTTEEPDAGILHVRVCGGGSGQPASLRRRHCLGCSICLVLRSFRSRSFHPTWMRHLRH